MPIRYRLKRSSGPVNEPIPAHPDAIYRPQNRPIPTHAPPVASAIIAPHAMANNPVIAAPLAGGGGGFSPWWIIGPLLALLAAMALGALAYTMKKSYDLKKQAAKENNEKTSENKENDGDASKSSVENIPLRSMKPDTISKEQKRTVPMSSTSKGNSTSDTDPVLSNYVNKEALGKSALPAHSLPLMNDSTPSSSPHKALPINVTRIAKPNSDINKISDEKNPSKTISNIFTDSSIVSPFKDIRSLSTHKKEPDYSERLPLASSTASTAQKLDPSDDDRSDSNAPLNKKDGQPNNKSQPNDLNKAPDRKSPSRQSSTNVGRVDHSKPLKGGHGTSSDSGMNDVKPKNKTDDNYIKQANSPEEHGIGKSPFISDIPTGTKRKEKEKAQHQTDRTKEEKASLRSLPSNPSLQKQNSPKGSIHSKKSKTPSSPSHIIHSKHNPLSESSETNSSTSLAASAKPTNDNDPKFSHPNENSNQQIIQPTDLDKSLTKSDFPNNNQPISHMPNVPQCKTNTSSDDDDYDELYSLPTTSKPPKPNKFNSNINASTYRKKRNILTHKSLTKRFHLKEKNIHSNKK